MTDQEKFSEEFKNFDMNLMFINRISYYLDYLVQNNPELKIPTQKELGEINIRAMNDAKEKKPATFGLSSENAKSINDGEEQRYFSFPNIS